MSRYIDADTLEEKAKQYSLGYYEADEWAVPLCEISEAPSIDIVRCSECKYSEFCEKKIHRHGIAYSIDFCSYGRKERASDGQVSRTRHKDA